MAVHAAPPAPRLTVVERPQYAHGKFVRWQSFLCSPTGCRLVVRTKKSAVAAPVTFHTSTGNGAKTFSSEAVTGRAVGGGSVDQADNGGLAGGGKVTSTVSGGSSASTTG